MLIAKLMMMNVTILKFVYTFNCPGPTSES